MIRVALLDMNDNHPNQGFGNIKEVAEAFKEHSDEEVSITAFDVRHKIEIPYFEDYDIFISSGGPGDPHKVGAAWEKPYENFLNGIWKYNKTHEDKKFLFLICHSFQVSVIYWNLAHVTKRHSYSYGVMPISKTEEGKNEYLFENLPDPFYAVDSRAFQVVERDEGRLERFGIKIMGIEKKRPYVPYERAIMAIRFSDEIFGTQFHPEANPVGFLEALKSEKNKQGIIEAHGVEKYQETIDRIHDEDKVILTRREILPRFLNYAASRLHKETAEVGK